MRIPVKTIVVFFAMTSFLNSAAQKIDAALNVLATQYPTEKIFIHYDKEYYVAGETVWFKAYLYSNGLPSSLSNNFYLQVINPDGKIISSKKYPVKGATVKGDIDLPDSLRQGYYHIRALTPGMLNTDPSFFYSKNIFVFNPSDKNGNNFSLPRSSSLSVQFFPESGYLVDGILSVLAFRAVDSSGMPVAINGIVRMDDTVNLAPFNTYHEGMGKVQLKPQYGKKYLAAITHNGQTHFFPLPEVQSSGINLRVEDEKGGKMFLLSRSKKEKDSYDKLVLVAEMNNMIVYENEINFESYFSVKGHLLTDSLPSGILHFTVFDKEGKPLAERLTFVNNGEYESNAAIELVKKGTAPREENIFEIKFPDVAQRSYSVSVTDADASPVTGNENIISKFLLTDDLKGAILNPAWYFRDRNDSVRKTALDDLVMIHGWSRFSWKKILAGDLPPKIAQDNYLISVSGFVKDAKTKELVSGGHLSLFLETEDSVNHNFNIDVNAGGKFVVDSLLIGGATKFYYAYTSPQGKEKPADLYLNPVPADSIVQRLPATFEMINDPNLFLGASGNESAISKRYLSGISSLEKPKELEPAIVKASGNKRPIDEVNDAYTSGAFTSMGKMNFDNINEPENDRSLSVFDFIKRSVKHVVVEDEKFVNRKNFDLFQPLSDDKIAQKQKTADSLNKNTPGYQPGDMSWLMKPGGHDAGKHFEVAIFLNESPTYVGILKTITMNEVALLKFYDPGFIGAGAAEGPGGAISVYTKKDISTPGNMEKLDHVVYNGYSLTREFYSPDYNLPGQQQVQEDVRTTLYWNPQLFTDASSKTVSIRFYNNDFSKKLKIVVEGFDATGRLIHIEKITGD